MKRSRKAKMDAEDMADARRGIKQSPKEERKDRAAMRTRGSKRKGK